MTFGSSTSTIQSSNLITNQDVKEERKGEEVIEEKIEEKQEKVEEKQEKIKEGKQVNLSVIILLI